MLEKSCEVARAGSARFPLALVRGGGDLGTGVAFRLFRCGFPVVVADLPRPTVIRRAVSFAEALFNGEVTVEGITARRVDDPSQIPEVLAQGLVPVVADPEGKLLRELRPGVVVDAIIAKRNLVTRLTDAPVVVALGPGFKAGVDCHAVVETNRGHNLGRVIWEGEAEPDTGIPAPVPGFEGLERVARAPTEGEVRAVRAIGDRVERGETIAYVGSVPVPAPCPGVLRGLIKEGLRVKRGTKMADVDPRAKREHCFTISDKALAIGGGVVEAVLYLLKSLMEEEGKVKAP